MVFTQPEPEPSLRPPMPFPTLSNLVISPLQLQRPLAAAPALGHPVTPASHRPALPRLSSELTPFSPLPAACLFSLSSASSNRYNHPKPFIHLFCLSLPLLTPIRASAP